MSNLICSSAKFIFVVHNQTELVILKPDGSHVASHTIEERVCSIASNPDNDLISLAVKKNVKQQKDSKNPNVFVYSVNEADGGITKVFEKCLPHETYQMEFVTRNDKKCLIAMNAGDLDCINLDDGSHTTLLGHIATATSFDISPSNDLIITTDRDARIRISYYPETYDIKAFGFFHEEFVPTAIFVDSDTIISADADGQVAKWNTEGKLLAKNSIYAKESIIRRIVKCNDSVAVIAEGLNKVLLINPESLQISSEIEINSQPVDISVDCNKNLWIAAMNNVYKLTNDLVEIQPSIFNNTELDFDTFSYKNQRVNSKQIIKKSDKGSDIFNHWRHPQKTATPYKEKPKLE